MGCSRFLENTRNIQKESSVHSIQVFGLKQIYRSRKLLNYSTNIDLCRENKKKPIEVKEEPIQLKENLINRMIMNEKQTMMGKKIRPKLSYHF
jgi:hypothetical protein